ncbi:IS3 family transposase, partial [Bathymodiolus thermophilus thioautotrophic gill symbiont]
MHIQFISGLITNIDDYIVFYNYRRFHQILKILTYENMSADKFW